MDSQSSEDSDPAAELVARFAPFRLTTDVSKLTDAERQMIPLLIEAADEMNGLFLEQAFGPSELASELDMTDAERAYFKINYGPWDRMNNNKPFVEGVGPKPDGANLYPEDMTKEEFAAAIEGSPTKEKAFKSLYTLIRRDASGKLVAVPYHEAFGAKLEAAAAKIREAAALAEDPGLKKYLELRAEALVTDDYQPSDMAWMDMKDNGLDLVIGAIETYEDQLFGYKAGFEAYVLVKDKDWSERLSRYAELLPELQRGLPVPDAYKTEKPGSNADLNAYDAVYYAGDSNAGSKTIAINLPNDEEVQLAKGTRRLQLKNSIQAKFDKILVPIAGVLIDPDQRSHITSDAFFANTMFHEVAHGLGIKNTLDGSNTVRKALKEHYSALEEGKADVLGLYMILSLLEKGELDAGHDVMDNMVTFTASIFRSIRFGASSAHGRANLIRYNFFKEHGAFERDAQTGTYRIDPDKTIEASNELSRQILTFQGDGDYDGVVAFVDKYLVVDEELQSDLDRVAEAGIPVDIVFEQGVDVLGL
ncbi:MAG: Zn-dependent hydrolase [Candidatus Latescibacterota bacterium]